MAPFYSFKSEADQKSELRLLPTKPVWTKSGVWVFWNWNEIISLWFDKSL